MFINVENLKPVVSSFIESDIISKIHIADDVRNPLRIAALYVFISDPNMLEQYLRKFADVEGKFYVPEKSIMLEAINKAGGKVTLPIDLPMKLNMNIDFRKEDVEKLYTMMASKGLTDD